MFRWTRITALGLLAGCAFAAALAAAPAPADTDEAVKDRAAFIPQRKHKPLPGKVVGVLVSDVVKIMGYDGRGGPPDAMAFSRDNQSYRWVYVPAQDRGLINGLQVPVGEKGDKKAVYERLNMANAQTVKQWDVTKSYALVEVEVNDEQGSPAIESFVATKMKVLDGSTEYPIVVADAIDKCKKKYKAYVEDQKKAIDAAMKESQEKAIKDKKPTGPRDTAELFYVTWMPEKERLRVVFRTTITDGAYETGGGVDPRLPPGRDRLPKDDKSPAFKVAPPRPGTFRWGTQFGVEFGRAYEVDKKGEIVRTQTLAIEPFKHELPPPPVRGGGPRELPPPPKPF
jgi:hypothetical protein